MKPQRVLALVHKGLEPPDEKVDKTTAQTAEWRMEYDVISTLKVLGHELRVIPKSVFCMLVLMALITTVMTTPILRRLAPGTELDEPIRRSGFFGKPGR